MYNLNIELSKSEREMLLIVLGAGFTLMSNDFVEKYQVLVSKITSELNNQNREDEPRPAV